MQSHHGSFVWYALMATDTKAASEFYRRVMSWEAQASPGVPGYTLFTAGGAGGAAAEVGGMMARPEEAGAVGARPGGAFVLNCADPQGARFDLVGMRR